MSVKERYLIAGWSSPVARQAHNLKVAGSNPAPATIEKQGFEKNLKAFCFFIKLKYSKPQPPNNYHYNTSQ